MSDRRRVTSDPKQGEAMSMSIAAKEAFAFLNAGTKKHYRGWGDTATAARDRAAKAAGITVAQAERVWKRWDRMTTVNGDVYRNLRNAYSHLCECIENTADAVEAKRIAIEEANAADESPLPSGGANEAARESVVPEREKT